MNTEVQKTLPPDTTIWRYMTFTKYVDLLRTASLYCARADLFDDTTEGEWQASMQKKRWLEGRKIISCELKILRRLIDVLEETNASSPQEVVRCLYEIRESEVSKDAPWILDELKDDFLIKHPQEVSDFIKSLKNNLEKYSASFEVNYGGAEGNIRELIEEVERIKRSTFLSCWHIEENQNMAMWKVYGQFEECVAVKTTFGKLQDVLSKNEDVLKQYGFAYGFKQVKYINKDQMYHPEYLRPRASYDSFHEKCIDALSLKHEIYSYEKELRLILTMDELKKDKFNYEKGIRLKIGDKPADITNLIYQVHVNPILSEDHLLINLIRYINKLHGLEQLKIVHDQLRTNLNMPQT